jgi:hypothetical protein
MRPLVTENTRIGNARETSLDCRGIRMTNTARLDANAHLVVAGIPKRPPHFSELSWFPYLNGFVALTHFSLLAVRHPRVVAILPRRIQRIAVHLGTFTTAAPTRKLVFDKGLYGSEVVGISANRCEPDASASTRSR